jgi:Uma2 family endonuclease
MTSHAHALPSNPIAPWAEIVPGAPPMTADDLLTLPDDGSIYEVVDGVLVRMAGSGDLATTTAMRLGSRLSVFVEDHGLGAVTGADGVYAFPTAETGLIPDVGFYTAARRALIVDRTKPIPFAPDLAVEVASPSQSPKDMAAKVRRYLAGGTRLVWVVWPEEQQIDVWHPGDGQPSRTLHSGDVLEGEDVVPGFTYPIARLFAS